MESMIKIIASDLDNTALFNGKLSEENKKAIERAIAQGIDFVPATGRGLSGIPREVLEIKGVNYALTSNGACIHDLRTGEIISHFTLSSEDVESLVSIGKANQIACEIFVDSKAYVAKEYYDDPASFGMPVDLVDYIIKTRIPVDNINEFIAKHREEIENFAFVVKDWETNAMVAKEVAQSCNKVFITTPDRQWVEVMSDESGKGKGLKHLCDFLGIGIDEAAAFGDADNDVEILEYAGLSIAMGNGSEKCKRAADLITLSVTENGLAYGIEKYILNSK